MRDVMLDIETMSTDANAVIVSIGAVFFDKEEVGDGIYLVLDRDEQIQANRSVSEETMAWWDKQSHGARAVFDAPQTPVKAALNGFTQFLQERVGNDAILWGNGSDFDNAVLASLYNTWGFKKPWSFRNNRCYRTLKNIALAYDSHDLPEREGVQHNALDDAVYQAAMAGRYLKGTLK